MQGDRVGRAAIRHMVIQAAIGRAVRHGGRKILWIEAESGTAAQLRADRDALGAFFGNAGPADETLYGFAFRPTTDRSGLFLVVAGADADAEVERIGVELPI